MEIKIPKEVHQHRETIFFGLSTRQFLCSVLAVGAAVGVKVDVYESDQLSLLMLWRQAGGLRDHTPLVLFTDAPQPNGIPGHVDGLRDCLPLSADVQVRYGY